MMSVGKTKRVRGRPKLQRKEKKRNNVTCRLRDQLRADLKGAGENNGRSLSEEIEARLEQSFEKERRELEIAAQAAGSIYIQLGGIKKFRLMTLFAQAIGIVEDRAGGKKWLEDPDLFKQVRVALNQILKAFEPMDGKARAALLGVGFEEDQAQHIGAEAAAKAIDAWLQTEALVAVLKAPTQKQSHGGE